MSDFNSSGIEKSQPIKPGVRKNARAYIKDADLQVHVPNVQEGKELEGTKSFKSVLGNYLEDVNVLQHEADAKIQSLAAGETEDLHEVTLAMDEAETSFELMMQIRNRLVDAYKELMRMQS